MECKIWFLCLLYEAITIFSSGAVTLPFKDLVATVKPIKPKPLPAETPISLTPKVPKVAKSEEILAYFKSQYLETDTSDIKCKYSSPLVLTSSSRPVPVPKIEGLNDESKILNTLITNLNNAKLSPPIVQSSSESAKLNSKRESVLTSEMLAPYNLSPSLRLGSSFILPVVAKFSQQSYPNGFINDYPMYYTPNSVPTLSSQLLCSDFSSITPKSGMNLPSVSSLPIVSLEPSRRTDSFISLPKYSCLSPVPNLSRSYSSPSLQSTVPPFASLSKIYGTMASVNPSYSVPYPLRYNVMSLPAVMTPSSIVPPNVRPISYADTQYTNSPNSLLMGSQPSIKISSASFENPYTSRVTAKPSPILYPEFKNSRQPIRPDSFNCLSGQSIINTGKALSLLDANMALTPPRVPTTACKINNMRNSASINNPSLTRDFTFPETIPIDIPTASEFDSSNYFTNNINGNDFVVPDFMSKLESAISDMNCNLCNDISSFQSSIDVYPTIPDYSANTPCFTPIREIQTENIVPQISLSCLPSDEFCSNIRQGISEVPQANIPDLTLVGTSSYIPQTQTSIVPSTYINVSPSYSLSKTSSNAVSSLNNVISGITQNILSTFKNYLSSLQTKCPSVPANPYVTPQCKSRPLYTSGRSYSPTRTDNNMPSVPVLSKRMNTPTAIPLTTLSTPTKVFLEPSSNPLSIPITLSSSPSISSFSDDYSSSFISYPSVVDINSVQLIETTPMAPVKVTLLPPTSFADYSPPRPCPSDLPSPILPSFLDMSPLSYEPQILKLQNLGKNSKTIEKLLELVFLTELLNGDTYVDWDALDTVLALLCAD